MPKALPTSIDHSVPILNFLTIYLILRLICIISQISKTPLTVCEIQELLEFSEKITRQDVILDAKNAYFSVLKAQKLVDVARDTVRQIAAQKDVAENMYQVGMSPLNDLLQSQVQLGNSFFQIRAITLANISHQ